MTIKMYSFTIFIIYKTFVILLLFKIHLILKSSSFTKKLHIYSNICIYILYFIEIYVFNLKDKKVIIISRINESLNWEKNLYIKRKLTWKLKINVPKVPPWKNILLSKSGCLWIIIGILIWIFFITGDDAKNLLVMLCRISLRVAMTTILYYSCINT